MLKVLEALCEAVDQGRPVVYTALVETRGSTPQKAGAAMLVSADGSQVGTLGGGCVEAEVKRRALALLEQGSAELMTFQLDSDYGWDDGLICGGRMRMLVDPVRTAGEAAFYRTAYDRMSKGQGLTEAVVLDEREGLSPGCRVLFDAAGEVLAQAGPECGLSPIRDHLRSLSARPRAYVSGGISYLPTLSRCRLIIVGAGHVGQRTAALAADVDFDVTIIDDRADYCSETRFPTAKTRLVGPIGEVLPPLATTPDDFGIVVTRGHSHDEEALLHLVRKPFRYLGMIGSRRKIRMIFDDLRREGVAANLLERVHAPLGFDIGSQTVPEIAVSIVAELIASRNRGESISPVMSLKDAVLSSSDPR